MKDKLKLTTGIKRKHDGNQSKHGRTKKAEKPAPQVPMPPVSLYVHIFNVTPLALLQM